MWIVVHEINNKKSFEIKDICKSKRQFYEVIDYYPLVSREFQERMPRIILKHYNNFNGQYSPVPIVLLLFHKTFLMIELRCNHKKSLFSSASISI